MSLLINLTLLIACFSATALMWGILRELRRIDGTVMQLEIIIDRQSAKIADLERNEDSGRMAAPLRSVRDADLLDQIRFCADIGAPAGQISEENAN